MDEISKLRKEVTKLTVKLHETQITSQSQLFQKNRSPKLRAIHIFALWKQYVANQKQLFLLEHLCSMRYENKVGC
jgi:CII-binding regulator of phage lambda lysogenization HflD